MKIKYLILLVVIYLAFIALGLPDALLGSAWNLVRLDLNTSLGTLGLMTVVVYAMSVFSTFNAPRILRFLETKKVVFISILLTGTALIMISRVTAFYQMLFFAIPLGLGAGAIDVSLNHYLASNYKAKHMNYLHSFYGIGVTFGPTIMAYTLRGDAWRSGYVVVGVVLLLIALISLISFPLWKKESQDEREETHAHLGIREMLSIPGIKSSILIFLFYVHVESLGGVWIASYFYLTKDISFSDAALFTSSFYLALTIGRFLSGVLTRKLKPKTLVRIGESLILISGILMLFKYPDITYYYLIAGLFGIGCAPIYPNMMYMNKEHFQKKQLSKVMSLQMSIGYLGFGALTPLAGLVFEKLGIETFPIFIIASISLTIFLTYIYLSKTRLTDNETLG